jgi:hypothetical protein
MPNESCDVIIFRVFLIFIKNQKKQLVIKELEKQKNNLGLNGSMEKFYTKFEPYVLPLGKFYLLIVDNYLKNIKKNKISKINKISKRTKKLSKPSKTSKSSKSRKGGFLFMLTDKGKEPITGDDVKKVLSKYNKAMGLLYYTRYAQDSTVVKGEDGEITADLAQPYTAMQAILAASSKDLYGIATNRGKDILSILSNTSEIMNFREYYNLYKLYMREFYKSEALHDPEIKKKIELAKRLGEGPPVEPDMASKIAQFTQTDMQSIFAGQGEGEEEDADIKGSYGRTTRFVDMDRRKKRQKERERLKQLNDESNAG